jgi:FemAB family protein
MEIIRAADERFREFWNIFSRNFAETPLYSLKNLEYQKEYEQADYINLSFVIVEADNPIAGLVLSLEEKKGSFGQASGFGLPVYYWESSELDFVTAKKVHRFVKEEFDRLLKKDPSCIKYQEFQSNGHVTFFGRLLLENGAKTTPYFSQVINLSLSKEKLWQQVRKSFKSLINWGKKNLNIEVYEKDNIQFSKVELFRELHIHVAGRETRSLKTWEQQYDMVKNGEAFLILAFLENELVTAAFFSFNRQCCYYGVSASKRELFDKPLSHFILWEAIRKAKDLNCALFETGRQIINRKSLSLPKKELGISTFKRGFGGKTQSRLNLTWERVSS